LRAGPRKQSTRQIRAEGLEEFGTSPQFWMNPQALYDVRLAEQQAGTEIKRLPAKPAKSKTTRPRPA
jgi:plasmid maintenance system antidote protein VapI